MLSIDDAGQIRTDAPEGTRFLVLRDNHSATTPKDLDTCVIRTHAPEGNALAGHRVNHSAKAPAMIIDGVLQPSRDGITKRKSYIHPHRDPDR